MNQRIPAVAAAAVPRIIPRAEHNISRSDISSNALRVLYRLKDAGFQAFLVGGGVRDVMIGRHPKDFDIATNALPDEVRSLFRNCRLVGRRFRLAHVIFGREVIEVATFRAASAPSPNEEAPSDEEVEQEAAEVEGDVPAVDLEEIGDEEAEGDEDEGEDEGEEEDEDGNADGEVSREAVAAPIVSDTLSPAEGMRRGGPGLEGVDHERVLDMHGRLLRDNVYGSIEEDVWRRDFTANSLYYNIADFSLWDFVGGAADIAARRLRLIGDPETRYREDPVRMLRAARFEAKLGFELDSETAAPIAELKGLLAQVPPARLFDETQKLFLTGHGERSLDVLRRRELFGVLFPAVERYLAAHPGSLVEQLLRHGLRNTDERVAADKPVTASFLFALLLYGPIAASIESLPPQRWHEIGAIVAACERSVREAAAHVTIPRRIALGVREMYALQPRLEQPRGRRALRLLEQPRFRAAFDLLALRAQLGLAPASIAQWWTELQLLPAEQRVERIDALGADSARAPQEGSDSALRPLRPRRRRRRRR
ncbi:MAG TPA: polynucleotide adenylyltransferase PcnB [Steroidobacteraceae bacterium]|nr:polynucleotide adenylyltransferase PcnB [Steroidobacteraceae bacterium]